MLVGGKQKERSRAGNRILQKTVFPYTPYKEFKTQSKLTECVRQQRQVAGRNVSVVNCPDWPTTPPSQKIKDVLLHGVTLCSPGPHAVLVTVDVKSSFSEADRRSVEEHMELLGDRVWRHALVLFMMGVWLGGRCVEEYIESEGEPLRWLLEKCGYRYHVLDGLKRDISEVTELMVKTEDMVMMNRGHFEPPGQKTLEGKKTLAEEELKMREEEWRREREEMVDRMLKFAVKDPEEPTLPVRKTHSMDKLPPSMSGGTPSEAGSSYYRSPDRKVSDWLLKNDPGTIASSSGVSTMSEPVTMSEDDNMSDPDFLIGVDEMSVRDEDVS